jgi:hypothetical protein
MKDGICFKSKSRSACASNKSESRAQSNPLKIRLGTKDSGKNSQTQ